VWIDLWRGSAYDSATGAFVLGAATLLAGERIVTVPAPPDELPLLVRAGAVLPLLPPDVDTLAPYGDPAGDLVRLDDRADALAVVAFPRDTSEARLLAGRERLTSTERPGSWELAVKGARPRTYALQASLATLRAALVPCAVEWRGQPLSAEAWTYDAGTAVLRAQFAGRKGRLVVRGCAGAG
jgi:hypothetical protein